MDVPNLKTVTNPPNPYHGTYADWIDTPPPAVLHVYEEQAKSIVTTNRSPDVGFTHSVNPYRGCFHGCAYCYARPSHQYLDFGAGSDFERKIVVKVNAPELLRKAFEKKSWVGDEIVFSGITDCYQPLEASYEMTRNCLKLCAEYKNPVAIITKGALIRRDIDILEMLNADASVKVYMSIAFEDDKVSKLIEPYAPRPSIRFRAMKALTDAGIPVGIGIAPVIPGLNEDQIPKILKKASECGAESAFLTLLRLPLQVRDVFQERIAEAFPEKSTKILNRIRSLRQGKLNQTEWGQRMRGSGPEWDAIQFLFRSSCEKHGIGYKYEKDEPRQKAQSSFSRPTNQLILTLG